ncbi:MAG: GIY-YIG nuclease family protein [Candidatus Omnitrophica bacterium]|nr:GIY-YIG nuclease family protein [Candidatus Omnitrophota bacterium]
MSTKPSVWWVYLLRCRGGEIYTGISTDVRRRVAEHNAGRGSKSLRGRLPATLVYREKSPNRSEAQKREAQIKRLPRAQKLALAAKKKLKPLKTVRLSSRR